MLSKEALGWAAIILTFVGFYPYVAGILRGNTRPHVFSWVIWATTTLVVFCAQLEAGGGMGAWSTGVSGLVTIGIALLAYAKSREISITRLDWAFFLAAMTSIPLWFLTSEPIVAVVLLTAIDLLGFGPTFRKVKADPESESLSFYGIFSLRNLFSLLALETFSLATTLFPLAITAGCLALMSYVVVIRREKVLSVQKSPKDAF